MLGLLAKRTRRRHVEDHSDEPEVS